MQHSVENSRAISQIHVQKRDTLVEQKLAAARSAAANFVRRLCRVFARGFAKLCVNCQQSVAIIVPSTVVLEEQCHFLPNFAQRPGTPEFGAPFWAPRDVFADRGLEKRKQPKNFESRAKIQLLQDVTIQAKELTIVNYNR